MLITIPDFSQLMRQRTEVVVPLTAEELERAVGRPARRVGVGVEPGLLEAIVADVREQPGALPMLQYALTELFERRADEQLTKQAYAAIGGGLGGPGPAGRGGLWRAGGDRAGGCPPDLPAAGDVGGGGKQCASIAGYKEEGAAE